MPDTAVIKHSQIRAVVLDEYAVVHAWLNEKVANGEISQSDAQTRMQSYEKNAKAWTSPVKDSFGDARLIVKLARDMKTWTGRVYFKTYKGVDYVIIKGRAGLRSIITGTRYKTTHPKIIEFQIGKAGLRGAARESFVFGVVLVTAIDITDFFLRDKATLGELCGNLAADVTKVAIAALAGFAIGAAVVGTVVGTLAIGPLLVALGAGFFVGLALDRIDEHFGLTERLSHFLDEAFAKFDILRREKGREFDTWLANLETSAVAVDLSKDAAAIWKRIGQATSEIQWSYGP